MDRDEIIAALSRSYVVVTNCRILRTLEGDSISLSGFTVILPENDSDLHVMDQSAQFGPGIVLKITMDGTCFFQNESGAWEEYGTLCVEPA
jgi:hypothetical protein